MEISQIISVIFVMLLTLSPLIIACIIFLNKSPLSSKNRELRKLKRQNKLLKRDLEIESLKNENEYLKSQQGK